MIARALPEHLATITGGQELDGMRAHLLARPADTGPLLRPRVFAEAVGIFAMVVVATFPVCGPFLFIAEVGKAMYVSQAVTLVMLLLAGVGLGRYASYRRPWATGVAMALFGGLLIAAVKALGG